MGWKWSKPQTPSKPSSSASFARRTTSSQGIRCGVTSSPKRMSVLWQVVHELGRPVGQVGRNVIAGLVADRLPALGDVLDRRRFGGRVHVPAGLANEDAGEAAEPRCLD